MTNIKVKSKFDKLLNKWNEMILIAHFMKMGNDYNTDIIRWKELMININHNIDFSRLTKRKTNRIKYDMMPKQKEMSINKYNGNINNIAQLKSENKHD